MRRLLAWGRQDPTLCPAEAASPPPLSTFHQSAASHLTNLFLPHPSPRLFSDIERQLSAKLAAEPLFRTSAAQLPSPLTVEKPSIISAQCSPQEAPQAPTLDHPTHINAAPITTATAEQKQVSSPPSNSSTTSTNNQQHPHLLLQQQRQQPSSAAVPQQQKGIDAFFAALASASSAKAVENGTIDRQPKSISSEHHQQNCSVIQQPAEQCRQPSLPALNCLAQTPSLQQQQQMAVAQSIRQASSNALAANLFVNALAAQRQQQQQQQQQLQQKPAEQNLTSTGTRITDPTALITHITPDPHSSPQQVAPLHQNLATTQQTNLPNVSSQNINAGGNNLLSSMGEAALSSALQLVQQTNVQLQLQQQQKQIIASSPLNPTEVANATLLNRLSSATPSLLHSAGPSKPIPLLNERVDLLQFKQKEPREWSSDDVIAWILDVARRHQIPCENVNLANFATRSGPLLMLMNEQNFREHDPNYGSLLFSEFCKLVTDENFIDDWMKANAAVAGPSSSGSSVFNGEIGEQHQQKPSPSSSLPFTASLPSALQQTAKKNILLGQLAVQKEKQQQQRMVAQMAEAAAVAGPSSSAGSNNLLLNVVAIAAAQQQQQKVAVQQQQQAQQAKAGGCLPPLNHLMIPPHQPAPSVSSLAVTPSQAAANLLLQKATTSSLQAMVGVLPGTTPRFPAVAPAAAVPAMPSAITSLSRMLHPMQQRPLAGPSSLLGGHPRTLLMAQQQRAAAAALLKPTTSGIPQPAGHGVVVRGVGRPPGRKIKVEKPIRRNKDGRPRKRSQHTKGNKLWEFIRDALKDPRTCPSIVRWEDPMEGVFRIVESERLAFLWGQKKNNQKMTYEKLSRAMRTYYEKDILVPVPKSGLYPKKLVYKFGPSANGWRTAASLAIQAHLAAVVNGPRMDLVA